MDIETPKEVSARLKIPEPTLAQWRHRSIGPDWFRAGRHVRYLRSSVDEWIAKQMAASRPPAA